MISPNLRRLVRAAMPMTLLVTLSTGLGVPGVARADGNLHHCIVDECVTVTRLSGRSDAVVTFESEVSPADHMNIMYQKSVLLGQQQFEVGTFMPQIHLYVKPGNTYWFSAQSCQRGTFSSTCSPWRKFSYRVNKL